MDEIDWSIYHDWVLDQIVVDWELGAAKVKIFLEKKCEIEIQPLLNTTIPRHLPWGMSNYINWIKPRKKLDNWLMEIELQSGDVISIEGGNITLKEQE